MNVSVGAMFIGAIIPGLLFYVLKKALIFNNLKLQ